MGAASRPSSSAWTNASMRPLANRRRTRPAACCRICSIRHRLLDQALWRRPLARRGRRVQRVAGSSHLNASNSNSGADLERQLAAEFDDDVAAPLLRWPRASANVNEVAAEESTEAWRSTGPSARGIGIWNS